MDQRGGISIKRREPVPVVPLLFGGGLSFPGSVVSEVPAPLLQTGLHIYLVNHDIEDLPVRLLHADLTDVTHIFDCLFDIALDKALSPRNSFWLVLM